MEVQWVFRRLALSAVLGWGVAALGQSPEPNRSMEQALIDADRTISEGIDFIAEGIDVFLARGVTTKRINKTRVVIENATFSSEGAGVNNTTHVRLSLHLPALEDSWQLKFTTYDEEEEQRDTRSRYLRDTPRPTSYGTSVAFFRKLGKVKTTFQPRVVLGEPLRVSHLLRFESEASNPWIRFTPRLELFARHDKGTGVFTGLNVSFPLSERFTFNLIDEFEYEDRGNRFSATNGVSLGQGVTKRSALSYSLMTFSNNRLTYHLEGYTASIGWNHLIYKNVLHYQVVPHLDFNKRNSYKGVAGAAFRVSLIF